MRGRLIFPVLAEICPFVPALEDPEFKEPMRHAAGIDGPSVSSITDGAAWRVPCQVEPMETEALDMHANGNAPRTQMALIFHQIDLARARTPKVGDRLSGLFSLHGHSLHRYANPPGLFAVEARPLSYGLGRGVSEANLLRVLFVDRSQAVRRFV